MVVQGEMTAEVSHLSNSMGSPWEVVWLQNGLLLLGQVNSP